MEICDQEAIDSREDNFDEEAADDIKEALDNVTSVLEDVNIQLEVRLALLIITT